MRGKAVWLAAGIFLLACSSAVVIYLTHPIDPHDEGLLIGSAALLWPFVGFPIAWVVCAIAAAREWRSAGAVRTLGAIALASVGGVIPFTGYYLNQKPWLSPAAKLSDAWPDVRARGAHSLSSEAPATAVPLLTAALDDSYSDVRAAAATALGKHGDQAASALPALIHALDDEDSFVGCHAGEALSAMRSCSRDVMPPLIERLKSPNATRAWCAATALGLLGADGAPAVAPLRAQLAHTDPNVRSAAGKPSAASVQLRPRRWKLCESRHRTRTNGSGRRQQRLFQGSSASVQLLAAPDGSMEARATSEH